MNPDLQNLRVENSLLCAALFLAARPQRLPRRSPLRDRRRRPADAEVIVPESLRDRAAAALERADRLLKEPEQGSSK
jgi:hypothetical protein